MPHTQRLRTRPEGTPLWAPRPEDILAQTDRCMVYAVSAAPSAAEVVRASECNGGIWYRSSYHVTWQNGRRVTVWVARSVADPTTGKRVPMLAEITAARAAVLDLTGREDAGWTFPALARQVVRWLDLRQRPLPRGSYDVPRLGRWHYQLVKPCLSEGLYLWDLRSAYWQMASRLPAPRYRLGRSPDGKLHVDFLALDAGEERRWGAVKARIEPHKRLRVALVGVNSAGGDGPVGGRFLNTAAYHRGKPLRLPGTVGPLQPLALLCIRLTWEVTQLQAQESHARYANADCVATERLDEPAYWRSLRLAYRLKASGPGQIRGICAWQIGPEHTQPWTEYVLRDWQRRLERDHVPALPGGGSAHPLTPQPLPRQMMLHKEILQWH